MEMKGMYITPKKIKEGAKGMFLAIAGGALALIGPFLLFYISITGWGPFGLSDGIVNILNLPGEYLYCWLIVVGGILALMSSPVAYSLQSRGVASLVLAGGLIAVIIPFVFAYQLSDSGGVSIFQIFYTSEPAGIFIYLGGILAIIGGMLVIIGGSSLIAGIHGAIKKFESLASASEDEKDLVDQAEVDQARQAKIEEREREEEERLREEEELGESVMTDVILDVPGSIPVNETGVINATIVNESDNIVKSIVVDLSDLEHHFQVMGSLRFNNIEPGAEITGSVKIKPKQGEGIYPVLIEIIEADLIIEERHSIKVEGTDSY
jgi:hypothetical protein